jgi:hypothetical protein
MVNGHSVTNTRHIASVFTGGALSIDSKGSNRLVAFHVLWTLSKHGFFYLETCKKFMQTLFMIQNVKEQWETFVFNIHIHFKYEG